MLDNEPTLIAACQAGRLENFDPLYRHYVDQIYAFVYRRTLTRETAEDLVSTVFLKAIEKIGTFDPAKGAFVAWLYRIARNTVTDHYRTSRPHADIEDVWDMASDDDVQLDADNRVTFEQLQKALNTLDADKREIVLLRLWDGLTYKEIADITGKSEGNCKVIFSRTIAALRSSVLLPTLLLLFFPPLP